MPGTPRTSLRLEPLEDRTTPSTATFVTDLYISLLHRFPNPGEIAPWVQILNTGVSPTQVTMQFTHSTEFQSDLIRLEYEAFLRRSANPAEVGQWLLNFRRGLSDEGFEALVLSSDEY